MILTLLPSTHSENIPNSVLNIDKHRDALIRLFLNLENDKSISEVIDMMKDKLMSEVYKEELTQIQTIKNGTFYYSNLPENYHKNRFKKLMCYDETRVVLSKDNNASDFINANYVDGHNQKNAFILTQGRNSDVT